MVERKDGQNPYLESSYVLMDKDGNPVGDENIVLKRIPSLFPAAAASEVSSRWTSLRAAAPLTSNVICILACHDYPAATRD